jgi:hypothetical protein
VLGGSWPTGVFDGLAFPASGLPARAQQVLKRLSLEDFVRHTPGTEACHHRAVRAPKRGCVRVAGQVEAVAFGQPGWSVCCPHALLNVARRLLDHTLVHPSAWKENSPKVNFCFTGFSEVQLRNAERFNIRRVMSSSCSHPSPTKE